MLAGINMSQMYENNSLSKGLAQVVSLRSVASEVMIKQMIAEEMQKQKKECPESDEGDVQDFVSDLMDTIMQSVVSKAAQPQTIVEIPSYDDWVYESEKPNILQAQVNSFVLRDFAVTEEGFLVEEDGTEGEVEQGHKTQQRDLDRTDSAKDVEEYSFPRKLKEVKSFALDDIDLMEEYLNDPSWSDEEDSSSASSSSQ